MTPRRRAHANTLGPATPPAKRWSVDGWEFHGGLVYSFTGLEKLGVHLWYFRLAYSSVGRSYFRFVLSILLNG